MDILFTTIVGALFIGAVIAFASWAFVAFETLIEFLAPYDKHPSKGRIVIVIVPLIVFFLFGSYILGAYLLRAAT